MSLLKSDPPPPAVGFFSGVNFRGVPMHYYQFNIGDYASHTRHLEPMEDLIYRRLLDLYYLHERPLNDDATTVAKLIGLRDETASVRDVLNEFFQKTDDGYRSDRADKEIAHYHAKIEQASRAGKASAERRNNTRSTDVQPNINQEPRNIKQEPKEIQSRKSASIAKPDSVDQDVWQDFLAIRKAKRSPMTATALAAIHREAEKAGWSIDMAIRECVARGWQGFKADWVSAKPIQTANKQAAIEQRNQAAVDEWLAQQGEIHESN